MLGIVEHLTVWQPRRSSVPSRSSRLYLLLAYHPAERAPEPSEDFDGTYYPLYEKVPRRFAIVRTNEAMLRQVDHVICYVNHVGNTRELLAIAQNKSGLTIENIAQHS